jgi:tellurite resistance protein
VNSEECSASLRVLLAVVRADGQIHQREKVALAFLATVLDVAPPSMSTELVVETECA